MKLIVVKSVAVSFLSSLVGKRREVDGRKVIGKMPLGMIAGMVWDPIWFLMRYLAGKIQDWKDKYT